MKNLLPEKIKSILLISEGWLVGRSISNIKAGEPVKDYDILVCNTERFQSVVSYLKTLFGNPSINSCGGLKFTSKNIEIDIWCEELNHFLLNANSIEFIYNIKKNILMQNL